MGIGVILLALLLLLGLILFIQGIRGRRVDDHPLCRKCGFDLTGKPIESTRCSECGADVSASKSIRIGHRQRRRGALITGLILLLLILLPLGTLTIGHLRGVDWQAFKPAWMLMIELKDPTAYPAALKEFNRRLSDGKLNDDRIRQVVAHVLSIQPTVQKWDPAWGDFVERAHASSMLPKTQWEKYLEQAVITELTVRGKVRRGDTLQAQITKKARFGTGTTYVLHENTRDDVIWIGGIKLPNSRGFSSHSSTLGASGGSSHGASVDLSPVLSQLPDGPTELRIVIVVRVSTSHDEKVPAMAEFEKSLTGTFDLRPASEPTVTTIDDPSFRSQLEKIIKIESLKSSKGHLQMNVGVGKTPLPVGVSFSISVLAVGREWKINSVAWPAGKTNASWFVTARDRSDFPQAVTKCDVLFRPDLAAAGSTIDVTSIWNGELRLTNVPVEQSTN